MYPVSQKYKVSIIHSSLILRKLLPYYIDAICEHLNYHVGNKNSLVPENDSFTNIYQCIEHLDKFPSISYDLFIVAFNLPVINGVDFINKFKQKYMTKHTDVILILPPQFNLKRTPINYSGYYLLEPIEESQFAKLMKGLIFSHFFIREDSKHYQNQKKEFTLI